MLCGFFEISGLVALLEGAVDRGQRASVAGEAGQAAGGTQCDGESSLTQGRLQRPPHVTGRSVLLARRRQQLATKTQQLGSVIALVALVGPSQALVDGRQPGGGIAEAQVGR